MDKSTRHKLQLIAHKTPRLKNIEHRTMRSVLDDMMIDEMSSTLSVMHGLDGGLGFEYDIGDGIVFSLIREQTRWLYRLETIWGALTQFDKQKSLQSVLRADGWVLSGGRLKTPAWLNDHAEIPLNTLSDEYRGYLS